MKTWVLNTIKNLKSLFQKCFLKRNVGEMQYEPIVFMNVPISDKRDDVMGIHPTVEAIKEATRKDAKLIGLVAEYGAGKSSVTETLAKDERLFGKAIRVNMWDSFIGSQSTNGQKATSEDAVNALTKSFMFQLASGISQGTARHVNRRLSKNYGVISFSIGSGWFWVFLAIAALCYLIFSVVSGSTAGALNIIISFLFSDMGKQNVQFWAHLVDTLAPLFLVLSIVVLVIGLRKTTVAFSHWRSQGLRKPEVNDVFETYLYVYNKLLHCRHRRLIIVDDLDRVDDQTLVLPFLKEIYRFTELPTRHRGWKKPPVFLISIKPEERLANSGKRASRLYDKIFDYTVLLKPIHHTDYSDILLSIIGDEGSHTREALQAVLEKKDRIVGDRLPPCFGWIIRGRNLTIRELKDRLNHAVSLLVSLKNKRYSNQSYVSFSSCAAVAYLEHQYPELYPKVIEQEDKLSAVVRQTYVYRNHDDEDERVRFIENEVAKLFDTLDETARKMQGDLVKMLLAGDISDDFRMYFYSFPKGSYIKNGDERDLTNLLLLPSDYPDDEKLAEKVERIVKEREGKTIADLMQQISEDPHTDKFPKIVLKNRELFLLACFVNPRKMENCLCAFASWSEGKREESKQLLQQVRSYGCSGQGDLWATYAERLRATFNLLDKESKIEVRQGLVSVFGDDILIFREFFHDSATQPFVTKEELDAIKTPHAGIALIQVKLLTKDSAGYVAEFLNRQTLEKEDVSDAVAIYRQICAVASPAACWKNIIVFLSQNQIVDTGLFAHAISDGAALGEEKAMVGEYVSSLPWEMLTEEYLEDMDRAVIDSGLSDSLVGVLIENGHLVSVLAFLAKRGELGRIDLTDIALTEATVSACEQLLAYDEALIPMIRREIIVQSYAQGEDGEIPEEYNDLFYGANPLLTDGEIASLPGAVAVAQRLNRERIDKERIDWLLEILLPKVTPGTGLQILRALFSKEYTDHYANDDIGAELLRRLDLEAIGFSELSVEDKETAVKYFGEYIDLTHEKIAFDFMKRVHCLIPSLEKVVAREEPTWYQSLIFEIDAPSVYTMEWLCENDVDFPLAPCVLEQLRDLEEWQKYLQGKVLAEGVFVFPYPGIADSVVVGEYTPASPIWEMIKEEEPLVQYILDNKVYTELPVKHMPEVLRPLYRGKQTLDFVRFVLDTVETKEAVLYLENMGEIVDAENSVSISRLLLEQPYIGLLEQDSVFERVKERLWENTHRTGYKSYFTRVRNEYFDAHK